MKLLVLILALTVASHAQTVIQSFDGDIGAGTSATSDHPNMGIASNGTFVVEITWQKFNIYNYSGVPQSGSVSIATFIANAGLTCTLTGGAGAEGQVAYISFISRWVFETACANADLFIVSSGSDPTISTWKGVALTGNSGDLTMRLGYDKNWIYTNEIVPCSGTPKSVHIALPETDAAWVGSNNVSLTHEVVQACNTYDATPEIDLNPIKGGLVPAYFVSRVGMTQNQTNAAITLSIDTFTPTSATAGSFSAAASPATITTPYLYNTPIDPAQPGSPGGIRGTESHRHWTLTSINSTDMQFVSGSGPCTTAGTCTQGLDTQMIFYWFDVAVPGLTLIQQAKISNSSVGYLFPSLGLDGSNNTSLIATGCGSSQFCSIYTWTHLASDAAGVIHGPTLQTAGTQNYQVCNTTPHPGWGDYSDTWQDPGDSTKIWAVHEYANSATPCQWFTHIYELQLAGVAPGVAATGNWNGVVVGGASK